MLPFFANLREEIKLIDRSVRRNRNFAETRSFGRKCSEYFSRNLSSYSYLLVAPYFSNGLRVSTYTLALIENLITAISLYQTTLILISQLTRGLSAKMSLRKGAIWKNIQRNGVKQGEIQVTFVKVIQTPSLRILKKMLSE